MTKKLLPVNAQKLFNLINQENFQPKKNIQIFLGNQSIKKVFNSHPTNLLARMAIPPWLDPNNFIYPVQNCNVCIVDTGATEDDYLDLVAENCITQKALHVYAIKDNFSLVFYSSDNKRKYEELSKEILASQENYLLNMEGVI